MKNISINKEELQQFVQYPDDTPVVMINLLKFKTTTADGESGEAVYARYAQNAAPLVGKVGGKLLWQGKAEHYLVGGEADRWDKVLLVEYPSRAAFMQMLQLPEFQEVQKDRLAALESTALITSTTVKTGPIDSK